MFCAAFLSSLCCNLSYTLYIEGFLYVLRCFFVFFCQIYAIICLIYYIGNFLLLYFFCAAFFVKFMQ